MKYKQGKVQGEAELKPEKYLWCTAGCTTHSEESLTLYSRMQVRAFSEHWGVARFHKRKKRGKKATDNEGFVFWPLGTHFFVLISKGKACYGVDKMNSN